MATRELMKLTTWGGEPAYIDPAHIRNIIQNPALPADPTKGLSALPRRTVLQLDPCVRDNRGSECWNTLTVIEEADDIEAMRQTALTKAATEEA